MSQRTTTTRQLARALGMMTVAHPAVLPAPLHFRALEREKIRAAKMDPTYNMTIQISPPMERDLQWWIQCSHAHNGRPLQIPRWDLIIETDASLRGWGASCQGNSAGGPWTQEERLYHINYLEFFAGFLALKTFLPGRQAKSVLNGQYHSNSLPKSDGGDPLPATLGPGSADMGVVHTQGSPGPCRTPARDPECQGRLALLPHHRLK